MMLEGLSAWFVVWVVTTQCVNFAFYLAITRVAYGWPKTLVAYLVYLVTLALVFPLIPAIHGGDQGSAGALSVTFISFFSLWGVLVMALSRGVRGRRLFAIVLCGIHQLIAFVLSLLSLRHFKSEVWGPLVASALMALMGWALIAGILPRVRRMSDNSGWLYLNIMTVALFVLSYASGIWPIFVAGESPEHILVFSIAAVVAVVFFLTALSFSEKSRLASSLAMVEDNLRLMANEMADRRETIAEARQIRNDRRNRCATLIGLLRQGKSDEALDYLRRLGAEGAGSQAQPDSVWCENETVNAVLSGYSRKASVAGLRFSAMASVNEQGDLPEIEIVEMVSNLLEIAIRTADGEGEVTCLLRQRPGSFGATVTNTVGPDFRLTAEGLPVAQPDACLDSVFGLVRRHHGECRYRLADGRLTCDALLIG